MSMTQGHKPYLRKDPEPCEAYFGNVCSGFGGSLTCYRCGWQRHEHPSEQSPVILGLLDGGTT